MTGPEKTAFYTGAGALMWVVWQTSCILGVILGAAAPESWSLDFAVPLTFIALLAPALKDRPGVAAAVASGFIAYAAHPLPHNLGLILASIGGMSTGYLLSGREK